jgi:cold shock CspA family protein
MAETWNKKEREKKKQANKKEKAEKKLANKDNERDGNDLSSMMVYLDEYGNFTSTPPDPTKKLVFNAEDMQLGATKHEPINPEDLIRTGTVTFFNEGKGYGFIKDSANGDSVFLHIAATSDVIKENCKVTFEIEMGPKGANAIKVKVIG